jgi:hypothetical protein
MGQTSTEYPGDAQELDVVIRAVREATDQADDADFVRMVVTVQAVHNLSRQQWSVRAIASALDMSKSAVNRILVAGPMEFAPPRGARSNAAIQETWERAIVD